MFDEDPGHLLSGRWPFSPCTDPPIKFTIFDFGARLWLERIRFFPRPQHHNRPLYAAF